MRLSIFSTAVCLSLVGLSTAADVQAAIRRSTNISAQGLGPALQEFAREHDLQVLYRTEVVGDLRTGGAVGELTASETLTELLHGTGLSYTYLDDKTVTIVLPVSAAPVTAQQSAATAEAADSHLERRRGFFERLRLAQGAPSGSSSAGGDASSPQNVVELEEVVVTGSRVRRSRDSVAGALTTLSRADIERTGQTRVDQVLAQLPQNFGGQSDLRDVDPQGGNSTGGAGVNLRGLGADSTLVLVNGRRIVKNGQGGTFSDLSVIPIVAIDRVEVLTEGASAIYGADAVGGVVNIILRQDVNDVSGTLRYGAASEGGYDDRQASLFAGHAADRFRVAGAYEYSYQSLLQRGEREFSSSLDYRDRGGTDFRMLDSNPGNVFASDGNLDALANLVGHPVPSAAIPAVASGRPTLQDFVGSVGQQNRFDPFITTTLAPEQTRHGVFLTGSFDLTEDAHVYADALFGRRETFYTFGYPQSFAPLAAFNVPATNPYNPFGEAVSVGYAFVEAGPSTLSGTTETANSTIGVDGRVFGSEWTFDLSASYGREHVSYRNGPQVNRAALTRVLARTDPLETLNLFGTGDDNPAALLESIVGYNRVTGTSHLKNVPLVFEGPVLRTAAGDIRGSIGGEWREEDIQTEQVNTSVEPPLFRPRERSRTSTSGFAELVVPLVGLEQQVRLVRALTFETAVRLDDYDDFGSSTNHKLGLVYDPFAQLTLRAAFNTAFKAPILRELADPVLQATTVINDPARGEAASVTQSTGGNPDLEPETARITTFGAAWEPPFLPRTRFAVNYYRVEFEDRLLRPTSVFILQNEAQFPQRVQRAAPTDADIAAGRPGRALAIDVRALNASQLTTSGFDVEVGSAVALGGGTLSLGAGLSFVDEYKVAVAPNAPETDLVDVIGNPPDLKGRGTLSWSNNTVSGVVGVSFFGSYKDGSAMTARTVDSFTTVDASVALQFNAGLGQPLRLTVGATNLFDEEPPFVNQLLGFDSLAADPRGRVVYAALHVGF